MDENEIREVFQKDVFGKESFVGIFRSNHLPSKIMSNHIYVVHTNSPSDHWNLLSTMESQYDWVDPLGRQPPPEIQQIAKRDKKVLRYSDIMIQSISSTLCGAYVCLIGLGLCRGISLAEMYMSWFSWRPDHYKYNDALVNLSLAKLTHRKLQPFVDQDFLLSQLKKETEID